jgi:thiol-disulfide isomerase/thioredoxin
MKNQLFSFVFCLVTLLPGFAQPVVKPGTWRVVLKTKGGDLPFGISVEPNKTSPNTYTVFALNGTERLLMDAATFTGDSLRIPLDIFETELIGKPDGEIMHGFWRTKRTNGSYIQMPFEARFGQTFRFPESQTKPVADLSGTWATIFRRPDSPDSSVAVGVFKQAGSRITGTFLTPTGDYRYLDGSVVGDSLLLSCFDGGHAFLFKAKYNPATRALTGAQWSGYAGFRTFVARFDPKATLPDPATMTFIKPGQTFGFSFPEPNGKLVSLADARFKGKVTVVQLLGTWCPNCMDETNFLAPWLKRNRARGVEVVGLAFERTAVMAESGPKIDRMKQRFGVDYPVVLAGTNNNAEAAKQLPALNRVAAFPTTVFVDKKGQVRHIHTGFSGPGTGHYYDDYVAEFNRLIDKLLAE